MNGGRSAARVDPILAILACVHLALAGLAFSRATTTDDTDIARFREIATAPGVPWRDHQVEYAPGETALILVLPGTTTADMARSVVVLALAADIVIAVALGAGWGADRARVYLAAISPLLTFLFFRLDLVVVALVVLGALLVRRRPRVGGVILGIATLTKLWPAIVVPTLARSRRGALGAAATTVLVGSLGWLTWGGAGAVGQVAGFRGARGWSVESGVGSIVWLVTGGPLEIEAGAPRTGVAGLAWRLLLLAALAAIWLLTHRWARAWPGDPFGLPSLTLLGGLLLTSPLFSLQYASWLVPSLAVAWGDDDDRRALVPALAAIALTGIEFVTVQAFGGGPTTRVVVVVRNLCVAATVAVGMWALARTHREAQVDAPVH